MEIYEKISHYIELNKLSKKEFAQKLVALEPKSTKTGEIISEKIVYSYLSGHTAIKAYLIPYISDVLGVPEQFFFEESEKSRIRMIKHISQNLSTNEEVYLKTILNKDKNVNTQNEIINLIKYAPEPMLSKIKKSLEDIRDITQKL